MEGSKNSYIKEKRDGEQKLKEKKAKRKKKKAFQTSVGKHFILEEISLEMFNYSYDQAGKLQDASLKTM